MAKPKNAKAKQEVSVEKKAEEVVKRGKFEFSDGYLVYEGDYITIEASTDPENAQDNGAELKPIIKRHGHGSQQGNGESYVGQWLNDAIHGIGINNDCSHRSLALLESSIEWRAFYGAGRYRFASGATYEGEFSHNRFHGKGVFTFADRSLYEGDWVDNR